MNNPYTEKKTGFMTRNNANELNVANQMQVDDYYSGLNKKDAGKLARAIEEVHGPRTASVVQDGKGSDTYSCGRVMPRPAVTRKPRTKKTAYVLAVK